MLYVMCCVVDLEECWCHRLCFFFCQAEDGIRDLVRSRGLGDVYKRQVMSTIFCMRQAPGLLDGQRVARAAARMFAAKITCCLLYTSDAADERSSVDLGGRRIIKKKKKRVLVRRAVKFR